MKEGKANRVLPGGHTDHSKHPLPRTQEKMDITRWSMLKSDLLYSFQLRWRSSIQSAKTRQEADYGSYHELLLQNSDLN